jgi:redox-sensitive bicupin YhaK (pirin superfamily)
MGEGQMPIELIIDKRPHDLGGGFEVGRVLPFYARRMVGPFIFFDQMGPVHLGAGIPQNLDVRPHPHIGLSTVTYLYEGAMTHRDSLGFHQEIKPGEVNWMVAGSGITHSERFEYARTNGANMFGIQAWVALPSEFEETTPEFYHHEGEDLPHWSEGGVKGRLIAGAIDGLKAAVNTHSPLFYVHLEMNNGARHIVSNQYSERAVFVAKGELEIAGKTIIAGQMAVLNGVDMVDIHATTDAIIMILGGEPVGKRFMFWNFVSSSKERLEQAKEDWKQGRMKLPQGDDKEFIPLPE